MKKLLLSIIMVSALFSCGNKTTNANDADTTAVDSDSIQSEIVVQETSLKCEQTNFHRKLGCWSYDVKAEYPVSGPETLLNAVRIYMQENLSLTSDGSRLKLYKGDTADGRAVFEHYGKEYLSSIDFDDYADMDVECSVEYTFKKEYEDEDVVTFVLTQYWYGGGAHGGTTVAGSTFRKSDGHMYEWDLVKKSALPEVKKYLKQGIMKHLEVANDQELADNLMVEEPYGPDNIPLPATAPWIEKDGVHFIYQQYEIACYAAGMPGTVIPTDKAKSILTINK